MRNVRCPRYGECLTLAARHDRPFDCYGCARRRESAPIDLDERFNCCLLLLAVFYPMAYAAHLQDLKKHIESTPGDGEA